MENGEQFIKLKEALSLKAVFVINDRYKDRLKMLLELRSPMLTDALSMRGSLTKSIQAFQASAREFSPTNLPLFLEKAKYAFLCARLQNDLSS